MKGQTLQLLINKYPEGTHWVKMVPSEEGARKLLFHFEEFTETMKLSHDVIKVSQATGLGISHLMR